MHNIDPNEMDALFKEGAENHEFTYNENSWAMMEQKLDNHDRNRRFLWLFLGLAIALLSIGAFYYMGGQEKSENAENIATVPTDKVTQSSNVIEVPIGRTADTKNDQKTTPEVVQNITATPVADQESYINTDSKVRSRNIGAQNSFLSENTGSLVLDEVVSIASQTPNKSITNKNTIDKSQEVATQITQIDKTLDNKGAITLPIIDIAQLSKTRLINLASTSRKDDQFDLRLTYNEILSPITSNRFAFTVFANPEWSSVGLFKESKAGWSFGGKIGYQFSDKFEISLGAAYSRKIYKGAGAEYTMDGGWLNDIEPMRMDAKCDVIEVPLALSYYANGYQSSGFFTELGVSSYMLHSEWYGFEYSDALVRPQEFEEVIKEDQNTHLVGVGRFAIGYQHVVSDRTSFQVSPYVQFPLTGIGAGQVNVYSSGVQLAVKFNSK